MLITGHTGFKGAWLTLWLERLGAEVTGISLPPAEPSLYQLLRPWSGALDDRRCDLRDLGQVVEAVRASTPEVVFHLAARAVVSDAFADPVAAFETNVLGTTKILEAVRQVPSVRAVVVVTTDKVYERAPGRAAVEMDRLGGDDPYSASKVGAELVARAYRAAYLGPRRVSVMTVRAGNVIGGGDFGRDRLVPDLLRALSSGADARLRQPDSTRPWQFVLDVLRGYLCAAEAMCGGAPLPPSLNFGPLSQDQVTAREIADRVIALWGSGRWIHDRGAHDFAESSALQLDATLAHQVLGWRPFVSLDDGLRWTVEWWRAYRSGQDVQSATLRQIERFEEAIPS